MRMLMVVGLAILVAGAALVPLPLRLESPGVLVEVGDAVTIELGGAVAQTRTLAGSVSGSYLVAEQPDRAPTVLRVAGALLDPAVDVRAGAPGPQPGARHPLTDAALAGIGAAGARAADEADLPIVAATGEGTRADSRSLAVVLHVFDTLAAVDLAAGRRIAVLGLVEGDGSVTCPARADRSVEAARTAAADVLVVPSDCDLREEPRSVPVLRARSFTEAVVVLRDGPPEGPPG
jgi:hypothetical protein